MTGAPNNIRKDIDDRLLELLAGRDLGDLDAEERAELEERLLQDPSAENASQIGELILAMDRAASGAEAMPERFRTELGGRGRVLLGGAGDPAGRGKASRLWIPAAIAAALAIAASAIFYAQQSSLRTERDELADRVAVLRTQVQDNEQLLADARAAADELGGELAAAERREIELGERLAAVTSDLDRAQLKIARYETPEDPEVLAQNRRQLLEVPDTIRLAWSPFDLGENAPAEQRGQVEGDVVWNDELETGYLRFVGLDPNDPEVEQYQVWVIDERGMEQKVSGGVFNANADGEIIVPIDPGIDVGRVALFAITVENPGGTWVPSLDRRVVVAPRDDES